MWQWGATSSRIWQLCLLIETGETGGRYSQDQSGVVTGVKSEIGFAAAIADAQQQAKVVVVMNGLQASSGIFCARISFDAAACYNF